MKKLNKIPSREIMRYDTPGGFERDNGFIFKEELPYRKVSKVYVKKKDRK